MYKFEKKCAKGQVSDCGDAYSNGHKQKNRPGPVFILFKFREIAHKLGSFVYSRIFNFAVTH